MGRPRLSTTEMSPGRRTCTGSENPRTTRWGEAAGAVPAAGETRRSAACADAGAGWVPRTATQTSAPASTRAGAPRPPGEPPPRPPAAAQGFPRGAAPGQRRDGDIEERGGGADHEREGPRRQV